MTWENMEYISGKWLRLPTQSICAGCCDCGLVHNMWFRIRKGKLEIFVERDEKATKILRAQQKKRKH